MAIRRDPIYISTDVYRWLRILAKCKSVPEENRITTGDEIADQILRQSIREQHPQLPEHEKEIDKLEKQLIKKLQNEKERGNITGAAPVEGGSKGGGKTHAV